MKKLEKLSKEVEIVKRTKQKLQNSKNTITEIKKNSLDGLNSKMEMTENQ